MQSLDGAPSFGVMNHLKHHCGHTWPGPLSVELNMGWVGTSWQGEITALSASGVLGGWGYLALGETWKNAPAHVVEKVGLVWVYEFKRISWPLCKEQDFMVVQGKADVVDMYLYKMLPVPAQESSGLRGNFLA